MVRKAIKYTIAATIVLSIAAVYIYRDTITSHLNLSSWMEKCIFCGFENRHHCKRCIMSHKQCPFCDKIITDQNN